MLNHSTMLIEILICPQLLDDYPMALCVFHNYPHQKSSLTLFDIRLTIHFPMLL